MKQRRWRKSEGVKKREKMIERYGRERNKEKVTRRSEERKREEKRTELNMRAMREGGKRREK